MTKKVAVEIDQTIDALLDIELEKRLQAQAMPSEALPMLTLATQAKTLSDTLATIWERSERELSTLANMPDFRPILDIVQEVLACKRGAKARHKASRAKKEAEAFAIANRAHFKDARHVQAHA